MSLNPFAVLGELMRAVLPAPVVAWLQALVEQANALLQGSPARAIGYGAAVVIWLVANAMGRLPDMTFDQAVTVAVTAVALLVGVVEAIRKYVFSPATVAKIVVAPPTAAGPIAAAVDEGVPIATIADAASPAAILDATSAPD